MLIPPSPIRALPDRRTFLLGAGLALLGGRALGETFAYKAWRFDVDKAAAPLPDALVRSLQAQVDIVETVNLKPEIRLFFRGVPKSIVPTTPYGAGAYSFERRQIFLSLQIDPPQNPVFLHELLHAYHQQRLPGGLGNPRIIQFFEEATLSARFPAQAYMFANVAEFFAMCASVVLWGRAARPPSTRANVRLAMPDFYDWIVAQMTPNDSVTAPA